jgi:hypothetical protein
LIRAAKICAGERRRKYSTAFMRLSRAFSAKLRAPEALVFREQVDLKTMSSIQNQSY